MSDSFGNGYLVPFSMTLQSVALFNKSDGGISTKLFHEKLKLKGHAKRKGNVDASQSRSRHFDSLLSYANKK